MSQRGKPTPEFRARWNAGLELVLDGLDPWLVLERVCWPSKAVEEAGEGKLPDGWMWTTEGERYEQKKERMRQEYHSKKAKKAKV